MLNEGTFFWIQLRVRSELTESGIPRDESAIDVGWVSKVIVGGRRAQDEKFRVDCRSKSSRLKLHKEKTIICTATITT
jgi:hypothetical protein